MQLVSLNEGLIKEGLRKHEDVEKYLANSEKLSNVREDWLATCRTWE